MPTQRHWREIPQRYRLEGNFCPDCNRYFLPPRLVCPGCGRKELTPKKLSRKGKIVTFTVIRVPPKTQELKTPYPVAIVETEEGARLTCQVCDCEPSELRIGQEVEIVFREVMREGKTGVIMYGYKARPV
ncbi:transcriptional regulator [candidate division WOR-3 bacterium]|uniref:Transcriptional regulator n=1 Tax=candidate division WOR-3 bacterium TaxID=2052148 RepID=A0A660SE97_UNCW3|nr:MAG: transcriptional regulator [candidate division WOR-3 bacterium]